MDSSPIASEGDYSQFLHKGPDRGQDGEPRDYQEGCYAIL